MIPEYVEGYQQAVADILTSLEERRGKYEFGIDRIRDPEQKAFLVTCRNLCVALEHEIKTMRAPS